jgi:hypothetical protein
VSNSYWRASSSKPENRPSRSSVSRNSSPTIVAAFVYGTTKSWKYAPVDRTWLMMPPRNATSVPARSGTCRSASALVLVNLGSTWITVAPRAFAAITHWNPTGWHSAKLEPSMTMQSECCRSCMNPVAPPRPNDVPSPTTVELWHTRAWFSICTTPRLVRSFLMR